MASYTDLVMMYRYDEGVVGMGKRQALLTQLYVHLLEIHNVESFVILLICSPDNDFLLLRVDV